MSTIRLTLALAGAVVLATAALYPASALDLNSFRAQHGRHGA